MKHALLLLLAAVVAAAMGRSASLRAEPAAAVLDAESQRVAVMNRAKDAVVAVFAANGQGGGSGVVITSDGYALTNFHVVQPCGTAAQCGMADGKVYDAVVVGIDPVGDVAVLKLFGRDDFPRAEIADSDQVQVGDVVFAMGNPFLLATDMQPTATLGMVSGIHRYQPPSGTLLEYTDCIQSDVSINPGNSGGPLFDAEGRLIGINGRCSFEKRGRVNVGAAYAISINQIKNFLGSLLGGRIVDHATLGARVTTDAEGRVVVSDILDTSDAYRRGLRYDDEIVSFGGRPVSTPNGFKNILGIFPQGWRVPLSYRRDGSRCDILVRLAGVHSREELCEKLAGMQEGGPSPLPKQKEIPVEEPKPDAPKTPSEEPAPDKAPDGKPLQPDQGRSPNRPHHAKPGENQPIPEIVQKHFEEKRGYANYFFNRLNRERVWKAWIASERLEGWKEPWAIAGQLDGGGAFRFLLRDGDVTLTLPSSEIPWTADSDFHTSLVPPQSGGLLPAMYLWRRLAVEGIDRFGEVEYFGTAPLQGHQGLVDVLAASHKGVECRFYFDPAEGHLLAMEMFPDEDADPCEIYFSDFHSVDGRDVAGRMDVRFGNDPFATFHLQEYGLVK